MIHAHQLFRSSRSAQRAVTTRLHGNPLGWCRPTKVRPLKALVLRHWQAEVVVGNITETIYHRDGTFRYITKSSSQPGTQPSLEEKVSNRNWCPIYDSQNQLIIQPWLWEGILAGSSSGQTLTHISLKETFCFWLQKKEIIIQQKRVNILRNRLREAFLSGVTLMTELPVYPADWFKNMYESFTSQTCE